MLGMIRSAVAGAAFCLVASNGFAPVRADPYRLAPGDSLQMRLSGAVTPEVLVVDLDGQVRLSDMGGVVVAGLTLDEAEDRLEKAARDAALYVNPRISLVQQSYAPVVISGDVVAPGRFDFVPGLTVAGAVALAGGVRVSGLTEYEIRRARNEIDGTLTGLNLDIARQVVLAARMQSLLSASKGIVPSDAMLRRIPDPGSVDLKTMIVQEQEILAGDRQESENLLAFWAQEIATIEAQSKLFDDQIALQTTLAESAAADLETVRGLAERGLQTTARRLSAEQSDATAKTRILELESAKIVAARAISDARRNQEQYLAGRRRDALSALQQAEAGIEELSVRYQTARNQLALLDARSGPDGGPPAEMVTIRFALQSPRQGRPAGQEVTPDTPLLPADTLIVTIEAAASDPGG